MKNSKRLFVFAGYDKYGVIDETLLYYLNCLSEFGDIVFIMDSDVAKAELAKLNAIKNILFIGAKRHNEYDFGSYKRGFNYAKKIIENYDWIYFVNDSAYGPLWNLSPVFKDLESRGTDLIGMADYSEKNIARHVQSWFLGVSKHIAKQKFFSDFMNNITHQTEKSLIILKYEVGLSQLILQHGYKMSAYISGEQGDFCHTMYDAPVSMLKKACPFVKKAALAHLEYWTVLCQFASDSILDNIYKNAQRVGLSLPENLYIKGSVKYKKCFRFTLFAIPFVTIYRREQYKIHSYKIYVFDKIPVLKIAITN